MGRDVVHGAMSRFFVPCVKAVRSFRRQYESIVDRFRCESEFSIPNKHCFRVMK